MTPELPPTIDTTVADPARRYDYWLGGKDNFAVDRESGDQIAERFPSIRIAARENRRFMRRAVTEVAKTGIDQFLDIGTGLPTSPNTHEIAHGVNPLASVVYVDNSPLVLVHARALLTAHRGAAAPAYIDGDLRDPASILDNDTLRENIDLTRPVGLLLIAVMHFITDDDSAYAVVKELLGALPSGSYLAMTHLTGDLLPDDVRTDFDAINAQAGIPMRHRSHDEFSRFFTGLAVTEPGIVPINRWRAETEEQPRPSDTDTAVYGALASKP
jgi:S-adenosyl methyltransferase